MVHGQQQGVLLLVQTQQSGPQERTPGQIKWTPGLPGCQSPQLGFLLGFGQFPQIRERQRQG